MLAPDFKVKKLRDDLCMVDKPARVHCDGKAIKTFFTNIKPELAHLGSKAGSFPNHFSRSFGIWFMLVIWG